MSNDKSNTNSHEYQDAPIFNDESKSKKDKGFPLLKANFEVAREFLSQFDEEKFRAIMEESISKRDEIVRELYASREIIRRQAKLNFDLLFDLINGG